MKDRIINSSKKLNNGCWEWQKATKGFGYGQLTVGSRTDKTRKTETAHRLSYKVFIGEIPLGKWVLHKCDNPKCVNPDHLYIGDRKQNVKDMMDRGRLNHAVGERIHNSIITEEEVIEIRKEREEKGTSYRKLAKKYGFKNHGPVMRICKGESWKHVKPPAPEAL